MELPLFRSIKECKQNKEVSKSYSTYYVQLNTFCYQQQEKNSPYWKNQTVITEFSCFMIVMIVVMVMMFVMMMMLMSLNHDLCIGFRMTFEFICRELVLLGEGWQGLLLDPCGHLLHRPGLFLVPPLLVTAALLTTSRWPSLHFMLPWRGQLSCHFGFSSHFLFSKIMWPHMWPVSMGWRGRQASFRWFGDGCWADSGWESSPCTRTSVGHRCF